MIADERRERILREIVLRGHIEVVDFAARTGLSGMTIRRDLAVLAERGLVRRVHGGAVLPETADAPVKGARGIGTSQRPLATIGFIVPDASYYFPRVISGASDAARAAGVRLVLGTTAYEPAEETRLIGRMRDSGVDAILLVTARPHIEDEETWAQVSSSATPVVLVERSADAVPWGMPLDAVRSDHRHGVELAMEHLVDRGHRRVGLLCRESATAPWLVRGHERAVGQLGIERDAPVMTAPSPRWGDSSGSDAVRSFVDRCIETGTRAAIVLPDELAISVLEAVEDRGLRVPDDFALVAYDDEIASLAGVPLTAVSPPKAAVGRRAVETCLMRLEERDGSPAQEIKITPTLTVRDST